MEPAAQRAGRRQKLDCTYDDIALEHLSQEMTGGDELEALSHELRR